MNLGATLYIKNTAEAVEAYKEAFGMSLGYHVKNEDGSFFHGELVKHGVSIFAVSESQDEVIAEAMLVAKRPTMSYGLEFSTKEEVIKAFDILKEGGRVLHALGKLPWSDLSADLVDKYGVYWYLTVIQHLPEEQ